MKGLKEEIKCSFIKISLQYGNASLKTQVLGLIQKVLSDDSMSPLIKLQFISIVIDILEEVINYEW
ncbi:hypothetical protein B5E58_10960 [Tyzzerella sp. An114]|uniref:hypothetical protein n=1 Tax=Tyzzerella sp. An114 TaxID=1965545 RepID=UPI000B441B86|nr:hypothetical protein [Tyzzerella sp. An114]OUQ56360.1 hypothetical protein B5E58_10960 [Tyzzerella sp. An114]